MSPSKFLLPMNRLAWILICLALAFPASAQKEFFAKDLEGPSLADGYGLLFDLGPTGLRVYELTSVSCIYSQTRPSLPARSSDSALAFSWGNSITTLSRTDDPNVVRLHMDWAASDIILHRIDKPPETCAQKPANSPRENYSIFWQTFAEQYAFLPFTRWTGTMWIGSSVRELRARRPRQSYSKSSGR